MKAINLVQSELDAPTEASEPAPPLKPAPLEAERRQITVMFADLADSTYLSSLLDPEDLRDVIKAYQAAVAEAVKQFGGNVAKFMGDGVLCYFGWPVAHEDDAERASLAGLKIVHTTATLTTPKGQALSARVGLATGLVVVGDLIGEGPAQENAIVGETPNLAARLQGAAQPGQVYADQLTRQLAGNPVDYEDLGLQEFKGFAQPITVWRAVSEATEVGSNLQAQLRATALPSIGRDHEAKLLEAKWLLAKDGEGQAVLLSGEAGIGKSHLMQQMIDTTADEDVYRMRFQCSPHHINTALYPVVRQFLYASRITDDDSEDVKLDKLKSLLAVSNQDDLATTALFADMLGLTNQHGGGATELTAEQRQSQTFDALIDQPMTLCEGKPVLVVFEDTHWLDPTTTLLLGRLIAALADSPIFLLLTCRSEFAHPWQGHPHLSTLNLNRLGKKSSQHLAQTVARNELPERIAAKIAERSGGIPLFIEELTRSVLDKVAGGEDEIATDLIPESLHGLLVSKLDSLGDNKPVAQLAAVIVREFEDKTIRFVAKKMGFDVDRAINRLLQSGLVLQSGSVTAEVYKFKHALIRDAAYESLLRGKRKELHAHVAAALERQLSDSSQHNIAPALALHFSEAHQPEKAVPYHILAGDGADNRNSVVEARAHFEHALKLASSMPPSEQAARLQIRATLKRTGTARSKEHYQSDLAELEISRGLAENFGLDLRLSQVLYQIGRMHYVLGQHGQVGEFVQKAFEIGEALGDPKLTAAPLNLIGRGKFFTDPKGAAETLARSVDEMRGIGDQVEEAGALGMLSVSNMLIGRFNEALTAANQSVALAEKIEHLPTLAAAKYYRGDIFGWTGDMKRCLEDFEDGMELAEKSGDQFRVYLILGERGFPHILSDNWQEAEEDLSKCVSLAAKIGTNFVLGKYQAFLAQVRLHQGKHEEALSLASDAVVIATDGRQPWARIVASRTLALVLATVDTQDIDKAHEMADAAITLAEEREMLPDLAWSIMVRAKVFQAQGDNASAETALHQAASLFNDMGLEREMNRTTQEIQHVREAR